MRSPWLLALPVAVAAGGLTGCGGPEPLTRAEYVKRADAICTDYNARQKRLGDPRSVGDIERLAHRTKPLVEDQLAKLRALRAPSAVAQDAKDAYDLLEQQLPKIDELVKAAKAKDVTAIQAVASDAAKLDDRANAKARKIGLQVCGAS